MNGVVPTMACLGIQDFTAFADFMQEFLNLRLVMFGILDLGLDLRNFNLGFCQDLCGSYAHGFFKFGFGFWTSNWISAEYAYMRFNLVDPSLEKQQC